MEAYLFRYRRRFIFCLCCDKERSKEFYDWINDDDSFSEYGFSREIKTGDLNGFSYLMVELLDHSPDNREGIKKQMDERFKIQLSENAFIVRTKEDLNTIFGLSLEKIVELHK